MRVSSCSVWNLLIWKGFSAKFLANTVQHINQSIELLSLVGSESINWINIHYRELQNGMSLFI